MSSIKYGERPLYHPKGKVYFIGDVHNEADKLMSLLDQLEKILTPEDHVVFLGDLVNRGKDAALTIEVLIDFVKKHPDQVFFVRGNHDWMLQSFLMTGSTGWFSYLLPTLEDFKAKWGLPDTSQDTISKALTDKGFREVVKRMIPYYESDETIGTHAPLDRTVCMMNGIDSYKEYFESGGQNFFMERIEHDILWTFTDERDDILWVDKFHVCGHQPAHHKAPRIFKGRAFIDTGAGKGKRPITCLSYPGKQWFQSKDE